MKKYIIILFLIFISSAAFTQWTGEVNLSQFTVQSQSQLNSCVDANGIHLIYWRNGGIKYARANYNGTIVYYYDRLIESEGANCDLVNVVSVNNSTLYAIYKKNNTINVKRSVNLGSSWSQFSSRPMTNPGCDKIVAYNDGTDIHIGWTEGGHSHYVKFVTAPSPSWTYYKNVTENEYGGGSDPDLTFSANEIHYLYKDETNDSHSRDKTKANTSWENPQYIPFDGTSIQYHKPVIANNKVNAAFRVYYSSFYFSGAFISNSDRPFDQGFWNENVWLRESEIGYETESESTLDNKIHFIYYDKNDYKWEHRYFSNSTLSGQIGEIPLVAYPSSTLIANSNDLYLLALGSISVPSWIRLQRYDVAPAPPTGLTITKSANNHPLLSWNANLEPDRYQYIVQKDAGELGWINLTQTSNLQYEDPNESYCTAVPPAQCPDGHWVYYRLKAVDLQSHVSDPSGSVGTYVQGGNPYKIGGEGNNEERPDEYALSQNYPNPFNPTTTINYAIKTAGEVLLKVYDMLGTEVASLVNETKEAGKYSATFNASQLPSGIYFYTLTSGNFIETRKLILLK